MRELRTINVFICIVIGIFVANISMQGCYYDNVEDLFPIMNCDTSSVSFSQDVMPITDMKCAIPGCHLPGGSGTGIFTNYAGIKDKINDGSFEQRVFVQGNMPPSGSIPLDDCELAILMAWVNAGAPDN